MQIRDGSTVLLSISLSATVNGSVFSVSGDALVLTIKKADIVPLVTGDEDRILSYDIVLSQGGVEDWFLGGDFVVLAINSASVESDSDVVVELGGETVDVTISGGNIGVGASVLLADLNQAVEDAEQAAEDAAASLAAFLGVADAKADITGLNIPSALDFRTAIGAAPNINFVVTDYGIDNTAAVPCSAQFQALVDLIESRITSGAILGANIVWPAGRYVHTATTFIRKSRIRNIGAGLFSTSWLSVGNFGPMLTAATNPVTPLVGIDVVDIGIAHVQTVAKTGPQILLAGVQDCNLRLAHQGGGEYFVDIYGGAKFKLEGSYSSTYNPGVDPKLNSKSAIRLLSASQLSGYTVDSAVPDKPTNVEFASINVNGPGLLGYLNPIDIRSGEHVSFTGSYYVGQATQDNVHIEQEGNRAILDISFGDEGYLDGSVRSALWMGGPTGDGSSLINTVKTGPIKGGGAALNGIMIDGTNRGGAFPAAVQNLTIGGAVSGCRQNNIMIEAAKNVTIPGVKSWGCFTSIGGSISNAVCVRIGPLVDGLQMTGGHAGGGTQGDGIGLQSFGVQIASGAKNITIDSVDVTGNTTTPIFVQDTDLSVNKIRVTNCNGFNGARPAAVLVATSGVPLYNPYGAPVTIVYSGGTTTQVSLNGQPTGILNGSLVLGAGDYVTFTGVPASLVAYPQ